MGGALLWQIHLAPGLAHLLDGPDRRKQVEELGSILRN